MLKDLLDITKSYFPFYLHIRDKLFKHIEYERLFELRTTQNKIKNRKLISLSELVARCRTRLVARLPESYIYLDWCIRSGEYINALSPQEFSLALTDGEYSNCLTENRYVVMHKQYLAPKKSQWLKFMSKQYKKHMYQAPNIPITTVAKEFSNYILHDFYNCDWINKRYGFSNTYTHSGDYMTELYTVHFDKHRYRLIDYVNLSLHMIQNVVYPFKVSIEIVLDCIHISISLEFQFAKKLCGLK
jgi:hypothetical protein